MQRELRRVAMGTALAVGLVWAGAPDAAAQFALPTAAARALAAEWPGWALAPIATGVASCAADAGPAISIDIDGDGRMDIAAAVRAAAEVRLVALLSRQSGYELYDIDRLGDDSAAGYLAVTRRGTAFASPRTGQPDYTTNDTITVLRCGQSAADLYQWYGFRFVKVSVQRQAAARPPA